MQRAAMGGECEEGGGSGEDLWDRTASKGWWGVCSERAMCVCNVCVCNECVCNECVQCVSSACVCATSVQQVCNVCVQ